MTTTSVPATSTKRFYFGAVLVAAAFPGLKAAQGIGAARWSDRASAEFEQRAGLQGAWRETWEPNGWSFRERTLWLAHSDPRRKGHPTGLEVRFVPASAMSDATRLFADADGWVPMGSMTSSPSPRFDPTRVESIHYRVSEPSGSAEGAAVKLRVSGELDRSVTAPAPWVIMSLLILAVGILPILFGPAADAELASTARRRTRGPE